VINVAESVTGIGGVFMRAQDADELRAWYATHLGIDIDARFGGAQLGPSGDGTLTWAIFPHSTDYLGRPEQAVMINYRVDDLDAMVAQLRAAGAEVDDTIAETEEGRFGWATDPEGNRFELWQPPTSRAANP
jgi:predicted enzyme related to lactoylglutathione lyase